MGSVSTTLSSHYYTQVQFYEAMGISNNYGDGFSEGYSNSAEQAGMLFTNTGEWAKSYMDNFSWKEYGFQIYNASTMGTASLQRSAWNSISSAWEGDYRGAGNEGGAAAFGLTVDAGAAATFFLGKAIGAAAKSLSLSKFAKGGGRVFWSGEGAMNTAMNYAKSTGGITLEMTRAGRNLQNLITTRNIAWAEARPMWARLSTVYAKGAKGTVHFFQGTTVNPGSIWLKVEKPILINNRVKIITH